MIELADLQGNVLCGYGFAHAAHLFLRVDDARAARAWLGALPVTSAEPWAAKPATTVNVALSATGLAALGMATGELPHEFLAGMASRAERLRDVPEDGPGNWDVDDATCHVLVTVHAHDAPGLGAAVAALGAHRPGAPGLTLLREERCALLPFGREHFGWADGLAQPAIDDPVAGPWHGQGTPRRRGQWDPLAPGEFVLGHPDEDGTIAPGPRNATFMVVRKLAQDVAAWEAQLRRWAHDDPAEAERLAALVVGRHKDGRPVGRSSTSTARTRSTDERAARFEERNAFRYLDDPDGARCPVGAHVRRANPRDAFGDGRLARRHRIIRRGMPYGPPYADAPEAERGLMFVCFQASIARQFELVQGDWLADGDAFGLGTQRDVLLSPGAPEGRMLAGRRLLTGHQRTVSLRGGGYFLVPSLTGLRSLGSPG